MYHKVKYILKGYRKMEQFDKIIQFVGKITALPLSKKKRRGMESIPLPVIQNTRHNLRKCISSFGMTGEAELTVLVTPPEEGFAGVACIVN